MQAPEPKKIDENKVLIERLKAEWKLMWAERYDDKIRAEGVSIEEYSLLNVNRGTIIHATRDYKALDFKTVLEENRIKEGDKYVQPPKEIGGWTKFAKKEIIPANPKSRRQTDKAKIEIKTKKASNQQPKKGGRGWLHTT